MSVFDGHYKGYRWIQFKKLKDTMWDVAWDLDNHLKNEDRMFVPRVLEAVRVTNDGYVATQNGDEKTIASYFYRDQNHFGTSHQWILEWLPDSQTWRVAQFFYEPGKGIPSKMEQDIGFAEGDLHSAMNCFMMVISNAHREAGMKTDIPDMGMAMHLASLEDRPHPMETKRAELAAKYGSEWT